jgi:hypothetical protein
MFDVHRSRSGDDHELVARARAARESGSVVFQVYRRLPDRRPDDRGDEFETARLVDLLEAEGWRLENVADAAEDEHPQAFGVQTVRIVGTIYTFGLDGS